MKESNTRAKQARLLRIFRKIHRITGICLFVFFFVVGLTGILLGWKKNSGGLIQAKTYNGTSTDLEDWLPLDSLYRMASRALHDSVSKDLSTKLDRIDIRNDKGMAKFIFADRYWGVQIDGATGRVLHVERRRSDFIEQVHDGSILDVLFGTSNGQVKLVYTGIMGLALIVFTITGFWLWYGPKRMRKISKDH